MAVLKCKMCGGTLDVAEGMTVCECEYCGTKQTVTTSKDENKQGLFNRANFLRMKSEFDKAEQLYEKLVQSDPNDAEAHWGLILCKFGIEYVEDPATFKRIPTCHRTSFDSIIADEDYKEALRCADTIQRGVYEAEAKEIDRLQKEILALSAKEEPYDVFICYKESDNGSRTPDSVIANDIYHQLTNEGFKVFYAAITLEDKLGSAYEPCIFAALNSAKVMLAIGTKPDYFTAVWVRNEWSRFLKMMKKDRSKLLIPCYKDMDAYELPEEFAHLQAQDMSKIGFINDLVRGIKKVIVKEEKKPAAAKAPVSSGNANVNSLLRRVFIFLEDGDWKSADEYCEKVLDLDPENGEAYLGKLMAEMKVRKREDLKNSAQPFDNSFNYKKIIKFGNEQLKKEINDIVVSIKERNHLAEIDKKYKYAFSIINNTDSNVDELEEAKAIFEEIKEYKASKKLAKQCDERIDKIINTEQFEDASELLEEANQKYNKGVLSRDTEMIESAIELIEEAKAEFEELGSFNNAHEKIKECNELTAEYSEKIELINTEKEKQEKSKKMRNNIIIYIFSGSVLVVIVILVIALGIVPMVKYNSAVSLLENGQYEEAIVAFEALGDYKDSAEKVLESKYKLATKMYENGNYDDSITLFDQIKDYSDSMQMSEYVNAALLLRKEDYSSAISKYNTLKNFRDSNDLHINAQYLYAKSLAEKEKYIAAIDLLNSILKEKTSGYKDSNELIMIYMYDYASYQLEHKSYSAALKYFEDLGNYKDSIKLTKEIYYLYACNDYSAKNYSKSLEWYKKADDYKDSKEKIIEIKDTLYEDALSEYNNKNYTTAINIFNSIIDYKDSKKMIEKCNTESLQEKKDKILDPFKNGELYDAIREFKSSDFCKDSTFNDFIKSNGYKKQIEAYIEDFEKYEGIYLDTEKTKPEFKSYYYYTIKIDKENWDFVVNYFIGKKEYPTNVNETSSYPTYLTYKCKIGSTTFYGGDHIPEYTIDTNLGILYDYDIDGNLVGIGYKQ